MKSFTFIEINFTNWEKHLKEGLILVEFWAEWCSACITQDKIFEEITEELGGNLRIGKVNVSDNRLLAEQFGVRNIPHLVLLKNGETVMQIPGIQNKTHLINQIKKHL